MAARRVKSCAVKVELHHEGLLDFSVQMGGVSHDWPLPVNEVASLGYVKESLRRRCGALCDVTEEDLRVSLLTACWKTLLELSLACGR